MRAATLWGGVSLDAIAYLQHALKLLGSDRACVLVPISGANHLRSAHVENVGTFKGCVTEQQQVLFSSVPAAPRALARDLDRIAALLSSACCLRACRSA